MKILEAIVLISLLLGLTQCLKQTFSMGYHRKLDEDCDLLNWCEGNLKCRDFRCKPKDVKDNQVPWAPEGIKCDKVHLCKKGTKCIAHRCESIVENTSAITPNTTNLNATQMNTTTN